MTSVGGGGGGLASAGDVAPLDLDVDDVAAFDVPLTASDGPETSRRDSEGVLAFFLVMFGCPGTSDLVLAARNCVVDVAPRMIVTNTSKISLQLLLCQASLWKGSILAHDEME